MNNVQPVLGANITQTLFKQNESLVVPSDSVSVAFQNLSALSGINAMPQEINNSQTQMPAYLQQAHLSTWYQDNPWETLTFSKKFGLPPMGGNVDLGQPPGYKPGNILTSSDYTRPSNNYPSIVNGMKNSQIMRENFGNANDNFKINWQ
jgi:hypothetical protein